MAKKRDRERRRTAEQRKRFEGECGMYVDERREKREEEEKRRTGRRKRRSEEEKEMR